MGFGNQSDLVTKPHFVLSWTFASCTFAYLRFHNRRTLCALCFYMLSSLR
jgi:hypothetical protein